MRKLGNGNTTSQRNIMREFKFLCYYVGTSWERPSIVMLCISRKTNSLIYEPNYQGPRSCKSTYLFCNERFCLFTHLLQTRARFIRSIKVSINMIGKQHFSWIFQHKIHIELALLLNQAKICRLFTLIFMYLSKFWKEGFTVVLPLNFNEATRVGPHGIS